MMRFDVGDTVRCISRRTHAVEEWTVHAVHVKANGIRYSLAKPGLLKLNVVPGKITLVKKKPTHAGPFVPPGWAVS